MILAAAAFSETGYKLAEKIAAMYDGTAVRCQGKGSHRAWTDEHWDISDALIYVGAAGIAIRSIAPRIEHKAKDPAVIVIDELGTFVIPVLSGHLGGANDLARELAHKLSAIPVVTTATDLHGIFAVDEWSKRQNMHVLNTDRIKNVSGTLLAGGDICISCIAPISGEAPAHVSQSDEMGDVHVDYRVCDEQVLKLVPKILVLGVGCRRGTTKEHLQEGYREFLTENGIYPEAVTQAVSIDVKKDEEGLIAFCEAEGLSFDTFSAEELNSIDGEFTVSEFVRNTVGVDCVCERSAVYAAGEGASVIIKKTAKNGVTFALAAKSFTPDWTWSN